MKTACRYCIVYTTCGSKQEAERISKTLVTEGIAACVQIDRISSCYMWEGRLCRDREWRLTIKTRTALWNRLSRRITELHSYRVPEIVQVPIQRGSASYLLWVEQTTAPDAGLSGGHRRPKSGE